MPDSPVLDLGFARLDLGRERRQGLAEVVYGPGKTREQITAIVRGLLGHNVGPVLVTRVEADTADAVRAGIGAGDYDPEARLLTWRPDPAGEFTVAVAAAGTSATSPASNCPPGTCLPPGRCPASAMPSPGRESPARRSNTRHSALAASNGPPGRLAGLGDAGDGALRGLQRRAH
jgi:hypothetical protein